MPRSRNPFIRVYNRDAGAYEWCRAAKRRPSANAKEWLEVPWFGVGINWTDIGSEGAQLNEAGPLRLVC